MALISRNYVHSPRSEWTEVNRLLTFHRLKLNVMVPNVLYTGPMTVSIYAADQPSISAIWVLASTYFPEPGELRIALSGKLVRCREGLKQAVLKTVDFLDWITDVKGENEMPRYERGHLKNFHVINEELGPGLNGTVQPDHTNQLDYHKDIRRSVRPRRFT